MLLTKRILCAGTQFCRISHFQHVLHISLIQFIRHILAIIHRAVFCLLPLNVLSVYQAA